MKRKRVNSKMDDFSNVLEHTAEFIPGRLYFITLKTNISPKSTASVHYFAIDTDQLYDSFYNDFGPLNLSILYHYFGKLDRKLSNSTLQNKKIVHYTGLDEKCRVNAAYLMGSYAVIKLGYEPEKAYEVLTGGLKKQYIEFCDASLGDPYTLSLLNCLKAVKKAFTYGFFDFNNFDYFEYEHYERVENGDLNWILPDKFLAFCGPYHKSTIDRGYPNHSPETYFAYFRRHNVTTIIRLNKKAYDADRFTQGGFDHHDLFFVDGGIPNERILSKFMTICENAKGAIAVHCKAGLGRTGTLIACYIMKHYKFTAEEAIAWIRICRPGSIIAHQQTWLIQKQRQLWLAGDQFRQQMKIAVPVKHKVGVYGLPMNKINNNHTNLKKTNDNHMTGIMKKVDSMEINDKKDFISEENRITQGDRLNEIKAQRARVKQPLNLNLGERKTFRTKVIVNTTSTSPVRVGRIITNTTKTTTSTRVLTKRNESNESQTTVVRRCSQRKINSTSAANLLAVNEKNKVPETKCLPKKKENLNWLAKNAHHHHHQHHESVVAKCSSDLNNIKTNEESLNNVKRGKRSLNVEKDKAGGPHLVKVLRRSHGNFPKDINKKNKEAILHLPSVKNNKSI